MGDGLSYDGTFELYSSPVWWFLGLSIFGFVMRLDYVRSRVTWTFRLRLRERLRRGMCQCL